MNHTSVQKLQELLAHLDGAYASNTLRAYKADMLEFIAYCEKASKSALPADPNTISDFLMQTMGGGIKSSTIRRKVSSISAIHRLSCPSGPTSTLRLRLLKKRSTGNWARGLIRPTPSPKHCWIGYLPLAVMTCTGCATVHCFWLPTTQCEGALNSSPCALKTLNG